MLLSVIIPFYQVEAYIGACLERAARLPSDACEVLLVDDCGMDGSAQIAAAYAQQHPHFRIIRREKNGGLSAARNTGLHAAQGEYVYFLDSDDLPDPQALMRMVQNAQVQQLDVVKARFVFFDDETGEETPGPALAPSGVMSGKSLFASQCRAALYEPMVWQCAYRRAFLLENGLQMAEGLLFEDELFQAPALFAAERTAVVDETILHYRQRAGSIMKSFAKNARWCASYLEVCRRLDALAGRQKGGEAAWALKKRVGQIALSVGKNIPAYHLPQDVAWEATAFLKANKKELANYALKSGDAVVAAQGALLWLSPELFLKLYSRI
ncbi:MAG: glycosyltransferase [Clostridia bacterium]|nr:glycosyltransferase [Clostridia bacterium]